MKFIIAILLTIGLGFIAHQLMPWWVIVIVAALVTAGMGLKTGTSFLTGFLGAALLWGIYATWINMGNDGILAARIGTLLGGLGGASLIMITALLAGIVGGLGGLTGSLGRQLFE